MRRLVPFVPLLLTPLVLVSGSPSYVLRTGTALVAVVLLCRTPSDAAPGLRRTRSLLLVALLLGAVSGVLSELHLLLTGAPPSPGWFDDWIYLAYTPFAVAAVLAVPRTDAGRGSNARALADGAIAAAALAVLVVGVWGSGLGDGGRSAQLIAVLGPMCAVFVAAAVLSMLPRGTAESRPFLRWGGAAMTALAVSDIGYAGAALGVWPEAGTWSAAVSQVGLALLVPAVLVAGRGGGRAARLSDRPMLLTIAPFAPVLPAVLVTLDDVLRGDPVRGAHIAAVLLVTCAVLVRHVLGTLEQQSMIDSLRRSEARAEQRSCTDELTGLGNRRALKDALAALPAGEGLVLAMLDLDDFKNLNDTQGHEAGDQVLRLVAGRLREVAPAGATVVRLGGDEFAVAWPQGTQDALAALLVEALGEPLGPPGMRSTVRASIGVVAADAAVDPSLLLAQADAAMYEAKADKRPVSRAVVLDDDARARVLRRLRVRDLLVEPDLAQFSLVYQPVLALSTSRVVGVEALLRWTHPELGPIQPATFIPVAEEVGSIQALGAHALHTALAELGAARRSWADRTGTGLDLNVGVNLSPRQLTDDVVDTVRRALQEHAVPPHRLVLEITEESLLDDWDVAVHAIDGLRAMGVVTAVDDFGTGWSSLRYLRRFALDVIKVDKEFVADLTGEPRTHQLVTSVVDMSARLGLDCVAEGIETPAQLAAVTAAGCRFGQGFLLAPPMAFADVLALLETEPSAPSPRGPDLPMGPQPSGSRPFVVR